MLFCFGFVAAGASFALLSQVLSCFDEGRKYFSLYACMPRRLVSFVSVQQTFLFCIPRKAERVAFHLLFSSGMGKWLPEEGEGAMFDVFQHPSAIWCFFLLLELLIHRR
jgi:hypothetical protein